MTPFAIGICILAGAPSAAATAAGTGAWNRVDQQIVSRAGVIPALADGFHGERPLAPSDLRQALDVVAKRRGTSPPAVRGSSVTVAGFDRALVGELNLLDLAQAVATEARRAGLHPPAHFGTEVVARSLGLRFNHPARDDRLELYPTDPITRAEAAYSLARVLHLSDWALQDVRSVLARFQLPRYTGTQRAALSLAVSKIGMPYVWGGESDTTASAYGSQAHGGYDCSGFVWRVFKPSGNRAGRRIAGRTAAQMAGEIPKRARIAFARIAPGDLLFFGPAGFRGRATERGIIHTGIALGNGFMIHSSGQGVYVSPLEGWHREEFAWARRVL